mmetsp:Transcript_27014/g.53976  ORF Transcript_27014/g.53976 Transcript_27014/m.53976 type:complete len:84 (-) Transcript_27014:622-873(-)
MHKYSFQIFDNRISFQQASNFRGREYTCSEDSAYRTKLHVTPPTSKENFLTATRDTENRRNACIQRQFQKDDREKKRAGKISV